MKIKSVILGLDAVRLSRTRRIQVRAVFCALAVLIFASALSGCAKKTNDSGSGQKNNSASKSIAVFIPGVMSGSAIYEMLASGVKSAVTQYNNDGGNASVIVIEAGYNQAEWETRLTSLAAQNKYDLIVSSNPSLPEMAERISKKFPAARFMLLDGELAGNPSIYTLRYNQREQAYMAGYLAGLLAKEKIGLVAAQSYPVMDNVILPGYREGAIAANPALDPKLDVDFRIVGTWSDATKAMELASSMIAGGADVILTIAGSGNEGVVQAATEKGAKVLWFDTNAYAVKPGVILGCSILHQDKAAFDKTTLFLQGGLQFGKAETVGIREGYVDFDDKDPLYIKYVSAEIRAKQAAMLEKLRTGY